MHAPREPEMHPASPEAVRRAIWLLVATLVLGSLAILAVQNWMEPALEERARRAVENPVGDLRELTILWYAAFAGPVLLLLGVAAWLGWLAGAVLRVERFPLPGMKVLRPVPVRRGREARRRGRWLAVYAALLVLAAAGILVLAARLHRNLLAGLGVGG